MDFLMSGEPEATEAIAALAAQGYKGSQVSFSDGSTWVSVLEDDSPDAAGAIAEIVRGVDPGAKQT